MPIVLKNVEWSQNDEWIFLKLLLPGEVREAPDFAIDDTFIKVNLKPYYYEQFLMHAIDPAASTCKLLERCIKFALKKVEQIWWKQLSSVECTISDNTNINKMELKMEMVRRHENKVATEIEQGRKLRAELKRAEIDKEIEREQTIRERIESVEKSINVVEIESQQQRHRSQANEEIINQSQEMEAIEKPQSDVSTLPAIRQSASIDVTFTKRKFVTPQRESQAHAEREWCLKQNEVKQNIGFSTENLSAEERDPKWLLNKGKEFYEKRNYLGAISAFSTGIKIAANSAELLLNRALAHFAIANYNRCAIDASTALDQFVPAVHSNLNSRVKCLSLRGRALLKMGFQRQGCDELKAALSLDPTNNELKTELHAAEEQVKSK